MRVSFFQQVEREQISRGRWLVAEGDVAWLPDADIIQACSNAKMNSAAEKTGEIARTWFHIVHVLR
jgi:hypothetical protein